MRAPPGLHAIDRSFTLKVSHSLRNYFPFALDVSQEIPELSLWIPFLRVNHFDFRDDLNIGSLCNEAVSKMLSDKLCFAALNDFAFSPNRLLEAVFFYLPRWVENFSYRRQVGRFTVTVYRRFR
jgi:hypothetical protein